MNISKYKEIPVNEDRKGSSSGQDSTKSPESGRQSGEIVCTFHKILCCDNFSGERAYFVLDITADGPSPTGEANKTPGVSSVYSKLLH